MKLLSEVRLGPRNDPLNLEMILFSLRPGSNTQSLRRKFAVSDWLSSSIWYVYVSASNTYNIIPLWQRMGAPWLDSIVTPIQALCFVNKNKFEIIFILLELLVRTVRRDW